MQRILLCLAVACCLLPGLTATATTSEVIVYDKMTDDGRKIAPPTAEHPAYYFLMLGGYKEEGGSVAGETKPTEEEVAKVAHRSLIAQHYLPATKTSPPPTLLIVVHWGFMTSGDEDMGTPGNSNIVSFNQGAAQSLVGGSSLEHMELNSHKRTELMQAAGEDRYFMVLSTYDFAAAAKQKREKKLLWQARMSIPVTKTTLPAVIGLLADQGGPFFGRETLEPHQVIVDTTTPAGRVDVGTPVEVKSGAAPEVPAAPSAAPAPAAASPKP